MTPIVGFMPDADPTRPGVLTDCSNAIPVNIGYRSAPARSDIGAAALAAAPRSGATITKLDGTTRTFVGTSAAIYELSGASWIDRSAGGGYSLGSVDENGSNVWTFAQFGDSTIAAASTGTAMQRSTTGAFSAISGAPLARIVETAAGFVVAFNTSVTSDTWYCSAYLDDTDWALSASTQCVTGRLVSSPGQITAAKRFDADSIVAYKRKSMFIGRYVGVPEVWRWTQVSANVGCAGAMAVADTPYGHYFVGLDDIYVFDGTTPRPIGTGSVKRWFKSRCDASQANANVLWDAARGLVWIFHRTATASTGEFGAALVYNPATNKWGTYRPDYASGGNLYAAFMYPNSGERISPAVGVVDVTNKKLYVLSAVSEGMNVRTHFVGASEDVSTVVELRATLSYNNATLTASGYRNTRPHFPDIEVVAVANRFDDWTTVTSGISPTTGTLGTRFSVRQDALWHHFGIQATGEAELMAYDIDIERPSAKR